MSSQKEKRWRRFCGNDSFRHTDAQRLESLSCACTVRCPLVRSSTSSVLSNVCRANKRRFNPPLVCRRRWDLPTSTTTIYQRDARRGNGWSGFTTFVGGPQCRAAGALLRQRSLSSLRVTSRPSSRRSDSALRDRVEPGNGPL